ncbi:MAG TPA: hypothetical protein VFW05_08495 [Verrucomicrobiae bacterium]|jgi:hypothetical protein|nr:hypothetical protein [Verrucomicrobiae bacterium]
MSLKAFHLIFVTALSSLAFGCSAWKFKVYADESARPDLLWAIAALLGGVAVLVYGKYFLKKLKNVSFL